jgi:hypothetical protein
MWQWTRVTVVIMLRMDARHRDQVWISRPTIKLWPPTRYRALLWMLSHSYRMQKRRKLTMQDYFDFLMRAKWKLYDEKRRLERAGHYLRVIDEGVT